MVFVLVNPSAVKVRVAVPGATPLNNPPTSTVKTFASEDDHVELVATTAGPFE
jgi:hypothetical protein